LLDDPDQVAPQSAKLAAALRAEVTELREKLKTAVREATKELDSDPNWIRLDPRQREAILREHSLTPPTPLDVSDDGALRHALDERSLSAWRAEADAVPTRLERARAAAEELSAPDIPSDETTVRSSTTVTLHRATLADEQAVREWLSETERSLLEAIQSGPVRVK